MNNHDDKKNKRLDSRLGTLRSELESLESDMKGFAGDVEDAADNRVHQALRKAEAIAHRAYRYAEESSAHVAQDVENWADGNLDDARKTIRAQPISALAISMGAGALVGAVLGMLGRCPPPPRR
ncbi:MAG: hypothetical protein P4L57_11645 [Rhizomicrobium sp.]|nr:hypothetical protein [Rhizomicrobium sp.]